MNKIAVGYKAITERLNLKTLPHYRESYIALQGRGKTIIDNHHEIHIYPKTYALKNENDLLENLEFALKYDGMNLEIIKALFENLDKNKIVDYIQEQPTGIYSRKIWYLYEFLMPEELPIKNCQQIKYVDLLNAKHYFTSTAIKSSRHAINDNLLGNKQFCPFIRKTETLEKAIKADLASKAKTMLKKYDPHLIARACHYLYTKETMSSYQIEKEQPDKNRVFRFVNLLQQAANIESLTKNILIELQNVIVDPRFKSQDYRDNQNYIGEMLYPDFQKIHYISPKPEDVPDLMQGLLDSLYRMLNAHIHPVLIAAAISFGFVFIHPFEDGNGRIHRFLIHYVLSKTDFTPHDMIFPVSFIMLQNMRDYDITLESFSKSLLSTLTHYQLTEDGIMTVNESSKVHYQYIDFTVIAEYLFKCIEEAIDHYIEREIKFLANYDKAKKALQNVVDMPDNQIDLFIKLINQNNGNLSESKRERFFSLLTDEEILRMTGIVRDYFSGNG
jgi:Fic family protein